MNDAQSLNSEADPPLLRAKGLTKRYRRVEALDDVSFEIGEGELVGLVGPNGAGKSTLLECVAGRLAYDEGSVAVRGIEVGGDPEAARRHLGITPQDVELYDYLTGAEYLNFAGDMRGVAAERRRDEVDELLSLTELQTARDRLAREYSGGMARKLGLAAAMIGSPPLLLLDEALVGLDPESSVRIRDALADHCVEGGSVLLSSHALEILETFASRILILVDGRLVRDLDGARVREAIADGRYDSLTDMYLEAADA